jgi:L-asparaginase
MLTGGCRLSFAAAILSLLGASVAPAAEPDVRPRKTVAVLATGGTIAGAGSATGPAYRSGVVPIAEILRSVPGLAAVANVTSEQVANVGSSDIDEAIWRRLLSRVQAALADPEVAGVVITHGTDTLEETAFFLSLLISSSKPVVLVGSMRPSTAVSADGPQNLLDAVRVASADNARNHGVMVVMNDTIFDPVSVTKTDFRRVNSFAAPIGGAIGDVLANTPRFFRPGAVGGPALELGATPLPRIAIAYTYVGFKARDLRSTADGAHGLVVAGAGGGGVPTDAHGVIRDLLAKGIPVVRTARQGGGDVWPAAVAGSEPAWTVRTIAGRELSPAKARILLMLALQRPRSQQDLQSLFDRYGLIGH